MKILVFYQYFGTPNGSWSTRWYEFSRRWVEKGHEVTVVTSPYYKSDIKANGLISRQLIEGINLIVINFPDSNKHGFLKRALNAVLFSVISIYYAISIQSDFVISSSGPITTAIPGLFAKLFQKTKFIFEVRDLWPKGGIELGKIKNGILKSLSLSFEKLIYKYSDLIVSCSPGMDSEVLKIRPTANTLVISNSSDNELFQSNSSHPTDSVESLSSQPIFIYAGSLGLMDDCSQIIYGLSHLKRSDYHFYFIGDGAEKSHLLALVEKLGLFKQVTFLGLIPKTELVGWFRKTTASFVTFKDIPVLHTNSPNKLFDSFSAGVPVIQSTKGWIANLVTEYKCGINVDPSNPQSFADAVEYMIENPHETREMGENAKLLAESKFDRTKLSDLFLDSLLSLNS